MLHCYVLLSSRGVYLASMLYREDKILVTTEDCLPVVEIEDENFSSNLHQEFLWFMKVIELSCIYVDVSLICITGVKGHIA